MLRYIMKSSEGVKLQEFLSDRKVEELKQTAYPIHRFNQLLTRMILIFPESHELNQRLV